MLGSECLCSPKTHFCLGTVTTLLHNVQLLSLIYVCNAGVHKTELACCHQRGEGQIHQQEGVVSVFSWLCSNPEGTQV